jgi:hypothetical protein
MQKKGIIVGCDSKQEGFLLWWWNHYSLHNSYPVVFADFGMSQEAISWCKGKGTYLPVVFPSNLISEQKKISFQKKRAWEKRFGKGVLNIRLAWLKKPFAILQFPWDLGLWQDLDCQVRGNLEPLFHCFNFGIDLAAVRDCAQKLKVLLPGEILYNGGVVAFRKNAEILTHWVKNTTEFKDEFPSDQEVLSRAIFLRKPPFLELPPIYNCYNFSQPENNTVISHFCGRRGKIAIGENMNVSEKQYFITSMKNNGFFSQPSIEESFFFKKH